MRKKLLILTACAPMSIVACVGKIGDTSRQQENGSSQDGNGSTAMGSGSSPTVAPLIGSDIVLDGTMSDSVGQAPTRRLSNVEIANAFKVLTGGASTAITTLPPDSFGFTFDRVVQGQTVIDRTVEGFQAMAEEAVTLLTDDQLATWSPACAVKGSLGTDGPDLATTRRPCAEGLLKTWAQTAYRRPLTDDEQATLLSLYDAAGTYRDGVDQIIRFVVQSPSLLYAIEHGTPEPNRAGVVALDDFSIASRLSLLFCETPPDPTLMAAAASGELRKPAGISAQAERLFNLPCARQTVQHFYDQWLNLISVPALTPDPLKFPGFNAQVRAGMQSEDQKFFDEMTWANRASLGDLFRADFTYADQSLASIYGLSGLADTAQKVNLPDVRRGFLTHPSILAITSHTDRTSPVRRGVFVLRNLLCLPLGNPPQNVNVNLPPIDPTLTERQQFEALTERSFCQACHGEINPIGFGAEDFDGIGVHRTTDNGLPVDSSGSVPAIGIDSFNGAAALSVALADRPETKLCLARKWLRFGLGRLEDQQDETSLQALVNVGGSGSLHDVMIALASTYAFGHRAPPTN
jgi:hypothetical protein